MEKNRTQFTRIIRNSHSLIPKLQFGNALLRMHFSDSERKSRHHRVRETFILLANSPRQIHLGRKMNLKLMLRIIFRKKPDADINVPKQKLGNENKRKYILNPPKRVIK